LRPHLRIPGLEFKIFDKNKKSKFLRGYHFLSIFLFSDTDTRSNMMNGSEKQSKETKLSSSSSSKITAATAQYGLPNLEEFRAKAGPYRNIAMEKFEKSVNDKLARLDSKRPLRDLETMERNDRLEYIQIKLRELEEVLTYSLTLL
jgi:hypothetical protein